MPMLKRKLGYAVPRKAKYVAGFLIIILANVTGMLIEVVRRQQPFITCEAGADSCGNYTDPNGKNYTDVLLAQCSPGGSKPMSDMSGWWTFLPYFITMW